MEQITSRTNPMVQEYVKLKDDKGYRRQTRQFVIEGIRLCREAVETGVCIKRLFVTQKTFDKHADWLQTVLDCGIPCYLIETHIEQKLADTKTPQGIFCICARLDNELEIATIYKGGNYAALCNIQDPGNLGTILRTAEAVGIDGVILSSDCCDVYSPKVLRSTMGSLFRLPIKIVDQIETTITDCNAHGVHTYAAVVDQNASDITSLTFGGANIILIGNEGNGLTDTQVSAATTKVTIPMKGRAESLNASMAAGILMYTLCK